MCGCQLTHIPSSHNAIGVTGDALTRPFENKLINFNSFPKKTTKKTIGFNFFFRRESHKRHVFYIEYFENRSITLFNFKIMFCHPGLCKNLLLFGSNTTEVLEDSLRMIKSHIRISYKYPKRTFSVENVCTTSRLLWKNSF